MRRVENIDDYDRVNVLIGGDSLEASFKIVKPELVIGSSWIFVPINSVNE